MIYNFDAVQTLADSFGIADAAVNKLGIRVQVFGNLPVMDLVRERIQYPHPVATLDQSVHQMRTNKTGPRPPRAPTGRKQKNPAPPVTKMLSDRILYELPKFC